jgi:hypothetical protein
MVHRIRCASALWLWADAMKAQNPKSVSPSIALTTPALESVIRPTRPDLG